MAQDPFENDPRNQEQEEQEKGPDLKDILGGIRHGKPAEDKPPEDEDESSFLKMLENWNKYGLKFLKFLGIWFLIVGGLAGAPVFVVFCYTSAKWAIKFMLGTN
jgi:hypothetical protein